MSNRYDEYIDCHVANVKKAYQYLVDHNIVPDNEKTKYIISLHDLSKDTNDEYYVYDHHFYNTEFPVSATDIQKSFDAAWLHHIHWNKHHWQHWVLLNDDGTWYPLQMPYSYVIEMVCDWWSFSWNGTTKRITQRTCLKFLRGTKTMRKACNFTRIRACRLSSCLLK